MNAIEKILLLLSAFFLQQAHTSHFRGGTLFWKPTGKGQEIEITARFAWTGSNYACKDKTVGNQLNVGSLLYYEGDSDVSVGSIPLVLYCSDYSEMEQWSQGEVSFTHLFDVAPIKLAFSGGAWTSNAIGANAWKLVTTVNTSVRSENSGKINSSPQVNLMQVIRILPGCKTSFNIQTYDPDGDIVRCRWAQESAGECGDACRRSSFITLDKASCTISLSTSNSMDPGVFIVALQVEDFQNNSSTNAMSSVSLQFLVNVISISSGCDDIPSIIQPSSGDDIYFNTIVNITIVAGTASMSTNIVEIVTVSPMGMIKSDLITHGSTGREWSVYLTWTPNNAETEVHLLCFAAYDSAGRQSPQTCVRLLNKDCHSETTE